MLTAEGLDLLEHQGRVAEANLVAVVEHLPLDALTIDESAVAAGQVLDDEAVVLENNGGVLGGNRGVVGTVARHAPEIAEQARQSPAAAGQPAPWGGAWQPRRWARQAAVQGR